MADPRPDPERINFAWVIRLRWGAIAGQALTIAAVDRVLGIDLPLGALAVIVGLEVAFNVAALAWWRRRTTLRPRDLAVSMGFDVVALTALLFFTGGPFNPFSFLYLVHIALGAIILPAAWTWALVGLSLLGSAALFAAHVFLKIDLSDPSKHMQHMRMHLDGMWVAFGVAAVFIVYFVTRVRRALAEREADLQAERALTARNDRLTSLATLAAGAAHELATPLGTIATLARELERRLQTAPDAEISADAAVIRREVERCKSILQTMAGEAGASMADETRRVSARELLDLAVEGLGDARVRITSDVSAVQAVVTGPPRALAQAIRNIVKNALDASAPAGAVGVTAQLTPAGLSMTIVDGGPGMPPEITARLGEPFFTTKSPGRGMGLGLFLARSVLEKVGGELHVSSTPGHGTTAIITLPAETPAPRATNDRIAIAASTGSIGSGVTA